MAVKHELETRWPTPEENPYLEAQIATEAEVNLAILLVGIEIASKLKDIRPLFVVANNGGKFFAGRLKPVLTKLWGYEPEFTDIRVSRTTKDNELGPPEIVQPLDENINLEGQPVVVVEDMIDDGDTLLEIQAHLEDNGGVYISYAVLFERLKKRPDHYILPDFTGIRFDGDLWIIGSGPDDGRILQPGMQIDTNLPLDGGRSWPGLWLNRPS